VPLASQLCCFVCCVSCVLYAFFINKLQGTSGALQLLVLLFLLIEMLPANAMYIIDGRGGACAATSMTSGGDEDRRIAYIKRGFCFHRASHSSKPSE
jgi:hypothetical protein